MIRDLPLDHDIMSALTITEFFPREHREHTVSKLGIDSVAELLKVHRVLPKLMAIFQRRIVEIGIILLVNSSATLLQQRRRFETE